MPKCKIAQLTSVHPTFDTRIFEKQCRSLAAAGFDVTLIAPHPCTECIDGVTIQGVNRTTSRWKRMTATALEVLKAALKAKALVYHFHDPELIPVGLILRARGKHVIYDVHEDTPKQILSKYWIPSSLRQIVSKVFGFAEICAAWAWSGIVAATPSIATRFPANKTITVNNYPILHDEQTTSIQPKSHSALVRKMAEPVYRIAYVGSITKERGILDLIATSELLDCDHNLRISLAGKFTPANLQNEFEEHPGWKNVDFYGWQNREQITQLLGNAHVGIVPLHPLPRFVESQPVKLYEYMASGLPVIASDFPNWRKIVEGCGCGLLVPPHDPQTLAKAIEWLMLHPNEAAEMGLRGQQAVLDKYNWQSEAKQLVRLYENLAGRSVTQPDSKGPKDLATKAQAA